MRWDTSDSRGPICSTTCPITQTFLIFYELHKGDVANVAEQSFILSDILTTRKWTQGDSQSDSPSAGLS